MKKIFHLQTCKTCQRIIGELAPGPEYTLQNVKEKHISPRELDWLASKTGSYESLFNRRSMKYRSMGLKDQDLSEGDYRRLILSEYTFLKRPIVVVDDEIFVGNAKKVVAAAAEALEKAGK